MGRGSFVLRLSGGAPSLSRVLGVTEGLAEMVLELSLSGDLGFS